MENELKVEHDMDKCVRCFVSKKSSLFRSTLFEICESNLPKEDIILLLMKYIKAQLECAFNFSIWMDKDIGPNTEKIKIALESPKGKLLKEKLLRRWEEMNENCENSTQIDEEAFRPVVDSIREMAEIVYELV